MLYSSRDCHPDRGENDLCKSQDSIAQRQHSVDNSQPSQSSLHCSGPAFAPHPPMNSDGTGQPLVGGPGAGGGLGLGETDWRKSFLSEYGSHRDKQGELRHSTDSFMSLSFAPAASPNSSNGSPNTPASLSNMSMEGVASPAPSNASSTSSCRVEFMSPTSNRKRWRKPEERRRSSAKKRIASSRMRDETGKFVGKKVEIRIKGLELQLAERDSEVAQLQQRVRQQEAELMSLRGMAFQSGHADTFMEVNSLRSMLQQKQRDCKHLEELLQGQQSMNETLLKANQDLRSRLDNAELHQHVRSPVPFSPASSQSTSTYPAPPVTRLSMAGPTSYYSHRRTPSHSAMREKIDLGQVELRKTGNRPEEHQQQRERSQSISSDADSDSLMRDVSKTGLGGPPSDIYTPPNKIGNALVPAFTEKVDFANVELRKTDKSTWKPTGMQRQWSLVQRELTEQHRVRLMAEQRRLAQEQPPDMHEQWQRVQNELMAEHHRRLELEKSRLEKEERAQILSEMSRMARTDPQRMTEIYRQSQLQLEGGDNSQQTPRYPQHFEPRCMNSPLRQPSSPLATPSLSQQLLQQQQQQQHPQLDEHHSHEAEHAQTSSHPHDGSSDEFSQSYSEMDGMPPDFASNMDLSVGSPTFPTWGGLPNDIYTPPDKIGNLMVPAFTEKIDFSEIQLKATKDSPRGK